jgi:UDP-N-acetylglucosamine 2-epimerase (non-hydrolysing)
MKLLFIFGTRPEAIKLAPVIKIFTKDKNYNVKICLSGQQDTLLSQMIKFFNITIDYNLNIIKSKQSLNDITESILNKLNPVLQECKPDLAFVHGDTSTAFSSALACSYQKIPVAHVEAGLRSHNKFHPWPEETNRSLIAKLSDYHFAPNKLAKNNLIKENISKDRIIVTGNTVIDSLFLTLKKIQSKKITSEMNAKFSFLKKKKKIILITAHRRENFGEGIKNLCSSLQILSKMYPDIDFVYPVHLNPNVMTAVHKELKAIKNVKLIKPVTYSEIVYLMSKSYLILTDSGGIQEEAPSLGKPVLVLREHTERFEAIQHGIAKLIGTSSKSIIRNVSQLIQDKTLYNTMSKTIDIFGDGAASQKIFNFIHTNLHSEISLSA